MKGRRILAGWADGKILYLSDETQRYEVYVTPF